MLRKDCPCDIDGICPYESQSYGNCDYWCGSEENSDDPEIWDDVDETFYDPYMGCDFYD